MNEIQYYLNKGTTQDFVCPKKCNSEECRIPIMGGMHNRFKSYEEYTLVYDEDTLVAYISKRCVPKGVEITNRKYWQPMNVSGYADDNIIVLADRDQFGQIIPYTLTEAIATVASTSRNPGVIISFFSTENGDHWEIWQYNALNVDDWSDTTQWRSIYNTENKFVGWYNSIEDLQKVYVGDFPGHYALIGDSLTSADIYEGKVNGWFRTDSNLYQEGFNGLINSIEQGTISLTNEQKSKFRTFICNSNEDECTCSGGSGSGGGETHIEVVENPYDDSYIKALIEDVQQQMRDLVIVTDQDVHNTVSEMIQDMQDFVERFGWDAMFNDSGWNEQMKAYIQTVGFTDSEDQQVSWTQFYQDFQTLKGTVNQITGSTEDGTGTYEAIQSLMQAKIENEQAIAELKTKWALVNENEEVLKWLVSGFTSQSGEDETFTQIFSALSQEALDSNLRDIDSAIAELETRVGTAENGIQANTQQISSVGDSISGLVTSAQLDEAKTTLFAKIEDEKSDVMAHFDLAVMKDGENGEVTSTVTFGANNAELNADGSGYLANGNISWDEHGNVTLNGTINANSGTIGGWTINENSLSSGFLNENIDAGHDNENKISLNSQDPSIKLSNTYTSYLVNDDDEEPGKGFLLHRTTKYVNIEADNENNFTGIILGQQRAGRDGGGASSSVQLSPSGIQINTTTVTGGYGSTYSEEIPISLNADGSGWLANGNFKWTKDGQISIIGQNEENQEISAAQFNKDGSGSLANGNLSWDEHGNISFGRDLSYISIGPSGLTIGDNSIVISTEDNSIHSESISTDHFQSEDYTFFHGVEVYFQNKPIQVETDYGTQTRYEVSNHLEYNKDGKLVFENAVYNEDGRTWSDPLIEIDPENGNISATGRITSSSEIVSPKFKIPNAVDDNVLLDGGGTKPLSDFLQLENGILTGQGINTTYFKCNTTGTPPYRLEFTGTQASFSGNTQFQNVTATGQLTQSGQLVLPKTSSVKVYSSELDITAQGIDGAYQGLHFAKGICVRAEVLNSDLVGKSIDTTYLKVNVDNSGTISITNNAKIAFKFENLNIKDVTTGKMYILDANKLVEDGYLVLDAQEAEEPAANQE